MKAIGREKQPAQEPTRGVIMIDPDARLALIAIGELLRKSNSFETSVSAERAKAIETIDKLVSGNGRRPTDPSA